MGYRDSPSASSKMPGILVTLLALVVIGGGAAYASGMFSPSPPPAKPVVTEVVAPKPVVAKPTPTPTPTKKPAKLHHKK